MTAEEIKKVEHFIHTNVHDFYAWYRWKKKRKEVLKLDHNECQLCKSRRIKRKANTVHHVHHLKDRPDLALEIYDEDGKRNLVSLCESCHSEVHPEKVKNFKSKVKRYVNEERW